MTCEPFILITICISLGFALGTVFIVYQTHNEIKMLEEELDYFRTRYHELLKNWKNKYTDD
jgi:hypothetical protein